MEWLKDVLLDICRSVEKWAWLAALGLYWIDDRGLTIAVIMAAISLAHLAAGIILAWKSEEEENDRSH